MKKSHKLDIELPKSSVLTSRGTNAQKEAKKQSYLICKKCNKKYISSKPYQKHINQESCKAQPKIRIKCDLCDKTFIRPQHLDDHMNFKHLKKELPCHLCEKVFLSRMPLRNHIKTKHSDVKNVRLQCDQCDKELKYL